MKPEFTTRPDGTLGISGTLDIYAADELRSNLIQSLDSSKRITIDLSGVDGCDVTAIQLLCAARKSAAEAGKHLEFSATSSAFDETQSALGLPSRTFANHQPH